MLNNHSIRPITSNLKSPFNIKGLYLGKGNNAIEILSCNSNQTPNSTSIRSLWKQRKGSRPSPLLVIVEYKESSFLCGPTGEDAPVYKNIDTSQIERICDEVLQLPDRHAALRYLRDALPAIKSQLPGLRNEGFLAMHELLYGVPKRSDWSEAKDKGKNIINQKGASILTQLGYSITKHDQATSILQSNNEKTAIAILLNDYESPELASDRFTNLSPVTYALHIADQERLPYVIIVQDKKIRLYPVDSNKGVGRRGRTDTFIELHTGLLKDDMSAYLWLIFSHSSLAPNGILDELLEDSNRFSGEVAKALRDRIYIEVIPRLCSGIVVSRKLTSPTNQDLNDIYAMAMHILYRLLFIAYAEDKDLLPYKWNGLYQKRSLKTKAQELLERITSEVDYDSTSTHWEEVQRLFRAIDLGNSEWGVPAYGGELFSNESSVSYIGNMVEQLSLPNFVMGPVLENLLLIESDEGLGPIDFRSLGVREFGTIYEGLLESELSLAEENLTVDKKGFYKPVKENDEIIVSSGEVYIHNSSGARKASGSYYTKSFAVDHLLDKSLIPALDDHFSNLDNLDDDEAGKALFDFKIADIAMGSGHFLINAIDKMEIAFSSYLSRRPLDRVRLELNELKNAAHESLGSFKHQVEIEDTQLLRRLIARRCVYGVDLNGTAVQLTRLAVWIHTFVPGLALSFLDHNLIQGNSLVGIGQIDEIKEKIKNDENISLPQGAFPLFQIDADSLLGDALDSLTQLAMIKDVNKTDLERARKAQKEAFDKVLPAKALFDITTYCRIENQPIPFDIEDWNNIKKTILDSPDYMLSQAIQDQNPLHFPIAFPEVFLRAKKGFDVIVGNPPWEEAMADEDAFWARNFPGLRGLTQREKNKKIDELKVEKPELEKQRLQEASLMEGLRKILSTGPFPGMSTGDADLYKAFSWRFIHLLNKSGRLGVVLPRTSMNAKGSTEFRRTLFETTENLDITTLTNTAGWVFDEIHPQYTIVLLALKNTHSNESSLSLKGPYNSYEKYKAGILNKNIQFPIDEVLQWNETVSLPLLPKDQSVEVFRQMERSPKLSNKENIFLKAIPYAELHATNDQGLMDLTSTECPRGYFPVFKGETFDIWQPDRGSEGYFAWGGPDLIDHLYRKRLNASRNKKSAFSHFDPQIIKDKASLPFYHPRIAFRNVTNRTNRRTFIVSLIPPNTFITNAGPYFLLPKKDAKSECYLLGIMSSLIFDWYARLFIEINANFFIVNSFPIPDPKTSEKLFNRVLDLSGRLACVDERYEKWGKEVGVDFGPLPDDEKQDMIEELDAIVAHLYGLNENQLIHIFETFHVGWDYEERLRSTLKHYNKWQ